MSDLFRNLAGQNSSSSRNNTQSWVDVQDEGNLARLRAKKASGGALTDEETTTLQAGDAIAKARAGNTPGDKAFVQSADAYKKKAARQGIEPSTSVSTSTGVPDLTDKAAQAAKMSTALQLISGRGRRQSMANGEYGDSMLGSF